MPELSEYARDFQNRLTSLSDKTTNRALRLWRDVSAVSLDEGWDAIAPELDRVMSSAQAQAASMASVYVARSLSMQNARSQSAVAVPESFVGVTRDGKLVIPELFSAVTATKRLIGGGSGVGAAFQSGTAVMAAIASTIIHDTGRGAFAAVAGGRGVTRTVRVVQAGACSRCAILAGATGLRPFKRHPRCRCTNMALHDDGAVPDGFYETPGDYFGSLSEESQDRVFTKAGAEAIRLGADPIQVVNARRGARRSTSTGAARLSRLQRVRIGTDASGTPVMGYVTLEGTTVRGQFGRGRTDLVRGAKDRYRRTQTRRLMPETILSLTDDVELRKVLLRDAGYVRPVIRDSSSNTWVAELATQRASDNAAATAFYRSLGIT